ncbi:hypothetical protein [Kitasatospora sp. NBC_00315]|uniref:hypothetical protein n=1 Tax=Kitasatospora sp. NBC_00315 TaxID=2975963 RepID=UPI003245ACEB
MTTTTGTAFDADPEGRTPAAPEGPWSVRGTGRGRPALEVYEHGELLDVVVASLLGPHLLSGARRCTTGGRPLALAWGRLPAGGGAPPVVEFTGGRLRPVRRRAPVVPVSGAFWLAWAQGRFAAVTVREDAAQGGAAAERLRLRRARAASGTADGRATGSTSGGAA